MRLRSTFDYFTLMFITIGVFAILALHLWGRFLVGLGFLLVVVRLVYVIIDSYKHEKRIRKIFNSKVIEAFLIAFLAFTITVRYVFSSNLIITINDEIYSFLLDFIAAGILAMFYMAMAIYILTKRKKGTNFDVMFAFLLYLELSVACFAYMSKILHLPGANELIIIAFWLMPLIYTILTIIIELKKKLRKQLPSYSKIFKVCIFFVILFYIGTSLLHITGDFEAVIWLMLIITTFIYSQIMLTKEYGRRVDLYGESWNKRVQYIIQMFRIQHMPGILSFSVYFIIGIFILYGIETQTKIHDTLQSYPPKYYVLEREIEEARSIEKIDSLNHELHSYEHAYKKFKDTSIISEFSFGGE